MFLTKRILLICLFYRFICVKREKFKTCSDSGFCNRAFNENLQPNRYTATDIICEGGSIKADLYDNHLHSQLSFYVYAAVENRLRIHINETNPKFPRFNVFRDAWKDITAEPVLDKSTVSNKINDTHCLISYKTGFKILVSFLPLRIYVVNSADENLLTINQFDSLYIEPNIMELQESSNDDPVGSINPIPHESFDGHTDNLPHGYQAVSFDCTFYGYDHLYGIPEHAHKFDLGTDGELFRMYNLDVFEYELHNTMALYGSIPLLVAKNIESTLGLLFLNSAEMWISLKKNQPNPYIKILNFYKNKPNSITSRWVAESGDIDVILMLGNLPTDVMYQNALTTGFPNFPPLFSTAYHQCRWNYNNQEDVHQVDETFDKLNIPYDVLWLDIEHTVHRQYFTFDQGKFPQHEEMITNISKKGRKLVTVVDPHVRKSDQFYVYKELVDNGFQSLNSDNSSTYVGWCWPGESVYPNFVDPRTRKWYSTLFSTEKYAGTTTDVHTWVDMNEPSVFNGPEVTAPKNLIHGDWEHRDIHNIYGQMVQNATFEGGLVRSKGKLRPFVLSRSFFAGSQKYGAIWTGDNLASWEHLQMTIPMLLSVSIGGIPFVGADVAGFFNNPSSELFIRWYQAASMQPFFRAHSHIDTKRREPWSYDEATTNSVRHQIIRRYQYLPYIYTRFYESSVRGTPIMRPLWFHFHTDPTTFSIEDSYLLGSSILIKPIVHPNTNNIDVYLPTLPDMKTFWVCSVNNKIYPGGKHYNIKMSSIDELPMFYRSGSIIPTWNRLRRTSNKMIRDPITLIIVPDHNNQAHGSFYMDDGETFNYQSNISCFFLFKYKDGVIKGGKKGSYETPIWLERVIIYGYKTRIHSIKVVSKKFVEPLDFEHPESGPLVIRKPNVKLVDGFTIRIK